MAKNDVGNFVAGFGETFFKTLQYEREREDKLKQQQQEFSQKVRESNLLNAYRNKMFEYGMQQDRLKAESDYSVVSPDPSNQNIFSGKDFPNLLDPNKFYIPNSEMLKESKPQAFDIEGSFKNDETGTYWTYNKQTGKPEDLGIPFDRNEGRSTTTNINPPPEQTTDYVNFSTVEEMIRDYNKRTDEGVPSQGGKKIPVEDWRVTANQELDKVMKSANISQEVFDKVWNLAGIKEGDDAVMKRKKLKNVLDQQPNLNDFQRRALYLGAEVRTR